MSTQVQTLSTRGLPAEEQAEVWRCALAGALHPVQARPVVPARPLDADFRVVSAGQAGITRGTVDPIRTTIRTADAANAAADRVLVTVHRDTHRRVRTADDRIAIAPGEVFAYFGDEVCEHLTSRRDESALLALPVGALSLDVDRLRRLTMTPLQVPAVARDVLFEAAEHVARPGAGLDPSAVEGYLVGVGELVLRSAAGQDAEHLGLGPVRRQQALDLIRARLADPALDPAAVAAALHVSRRRLYQVFEGTAGVAATIRRMRVERAVELLSTAGVARSRGVAHVARACGFRSVSHFSRVVRAETGRRPSEFVPA